MLDFFGGCFAGERVFAHDIAAQRAVADLRDHVHAQLALFDERHVFAEGLPGQRRVLQQRFFRHFFRRAKYAEQIVLIPRAHRRERKTAIAHQNRGHAMRSGRIDDRIPKQLAVIMSMGVDKARSRDLAANINRVLGVPVHGANRRDPPVLHRDVTLIGFRAGAIDDQRILDDKIIGHIECRPLMPRADTRERHL